MAWQISVLIARFLDDWSDRLCFSYRSLSIQASRLMTKMKERGVNPNAFTYTTLITGYAKYGEISKVLELFNAMREEVRKNTFLFRSVVDMIQRLLLRLPLT